MSFNFRREVKIPADIKVLALQNQELVKDFNPANGQKYEENRIAIIDKINNYEPKIQELIREKLNIKYGLPDVNTKGGKRKSRKQKKSLRRKSRKARKSQKKRR